MGHVSTYHATLTKVKKNIDDIKFLWHFDKVKSAQKVIQTLLLIAFLFLCIDLQ